MPEVKTQPVTATLFNDIDQVHTKPGAFEYYKDKDGYPAGMLYCCPCGCGATGALAFRPRQSPSWDWDGNLEKPTLQPSVHHPGHWHGYLTAGVWISC